MSMAPSTQVTRGDSQPLGTGTQPVTVALDGNEVALLQACVGFHAKAQSDPSVRSRLYALWCKLDEVRPSRAA